MVVYPAGPLGISQWGNVSGFIVGYRPDSPGKAPADREAGMAPLAAVPFSFHAAVRVPWPALSVR